MLKCNSINQIIQNNQINMINQVKLAHHRTDFGLVYKACILLSKKSPKAGSLKAGSTKALWKLYESSLKAPSKQALRKHSDISLRALSKLYESFPKAGSPKEALRKQADFYWKPFKSKLTFVDNVDNVESSIVAFQKARISRQY